MKTVPGLTVAAICAALTGCAVSHGTARPTPFSTELRNRILRYYHPPSPPPPQTQPQPRSGVQTPKPDAVRDTWSRRGYTTVLDDDAKTLYLSGRPGTAKIDRKSGNIVWFTAMACTAGILAENDLYAACGGRVIKLNALTGETMQRSAPVPFDVTELALAGAHAIVVNPVQSQTAASTTVLFLDRDTLKPWTPHFK